VKQFLFGFALLGLGALCLNGARGQLPGTFMPISVGVSGGALACTPNTQGGGTDSNVIALWHMDNAGTDVALGGARPLTLNGGAVYSTTQKKFGSHSLSIVTGGTSYAQMPAGVLVPASTDFTLETWMYFAGTTPTYHGWLGDDQATFLGPYGSPNLSIQIAGSSVSATTATTTNSFSANAWHHYAVTRLSGAIGFWVDGVSQAATGSNANVVGGTGSGVKIGRAYSATYVQPSGSFLDEVRISNVARYTANFVPPILPFCDPQTGGGGSPSAATCTVTGAGNVAAAFGAHWRYTMVVSGTITCPTGPRAVRHCIIGGGGSGGAASIGASGGGGGGMQVGSSASLANGANTVTVAGSVAGGSSSDGLDGQNSVALGLTATGGKKGIGSNVGAGGNAGTPAGALGGATAASKPGGGGGGGPDGTPGLAPVTNGGKGGDGSICPIDSVQYAGGGGAVTNGALTDGNGAGQNGPGGGSAGATIGSQAGQGGKVIIEEL
jgi:Concanavalin A-like lectin/glucanases superfamily